MPQKIKFQPLLKNKAAYSLISLMHLDPEKPSPAPFTPKHGANQPANRKVENIPLITTFGECNEYLTVHKTYDDT